MFRLSNLRFRASDLGLTSFGTQEAHKHKHFMGISIPYWPSFLRRVLLDILILVFAYVLFFNLGPYKPKS